MQTATRPEISEMIAGSKGIVEGAKTRLLTVFEFVPDDKLNWSPSPESRTPVQIVSHCGAANDAFARTIRGEKLELPSNPAEAAAMIRKAGSEVTSREVAVRMIEDTVAQVLSALDNVKREDLDTSPVSPVGPLPFSWWMSFAGKHMEGHTHQMSYVQTIWGDYDDHILGPGEFRSR